MKPFTESMRYDYPLTPDDLVLDVGGYEGNFAAEIYSKFRCRVRIYEACWQFAVGLRERFKENKEVSVFGVAVGAENGEVKIAIRGDSTGEFTESGSVQISPRLDIKEIANECGTIALLKLNCEGSEYAVLERILECGIAGKFKNIQVQFHTCAPNYAKRYAAIREGLNKTHRITFDEPFVWQGWELR